MKKGKLTMCLSLLLIAIFALSSFALAQAEPSSYLPAPTDRSEEFYAKQLESIQVYNQILDSFMDQSRVLSLGDTDQVYPDYYGGAYIDEETGGLVVLVTDLSEIPQTLQSISADSLDVEYEVCSISFNQMIEAIDTITAKIPQLAEEGVIIDSVGDDIMNGRVVVSVRELDKEKEEKIKAVADYAFLYMENSYGVDRNIWYGAGHKISDANGATSTIGFAAIQNMAGTGNVYGFVIAGHAAETVGGSFKVGDTTIGIATHTAWYDYSSADVAFVAAASGITTTNEIAFGGIIVDAETAVLPINTTVYKYGYRTGLTGGVVKSIYRTVDYKEEDDDGNIISRHRIVGICSADYVSNKGDSGGPVMIYVGSDSGYAEYRLYGVHSGNNATGETTSYFSPYCNIITELGVTCRLTGG